MKIKMTEGRVLRKRMLCMREGSIYNILKHFICCSMEREYGNENVMSLTNNGDSNVNEFHLLSSRDKISLTLISRYFSVFY